MSFRFSTLIAAFLAAWLLAYASYATASTPERLAYKIHLTPPGAAAVSLHVEEWGRGPAIVLIHGIGGSRYTFRRIVAPLARRHRVITLDLKGFGASDKPFDNAYGAADQAKLLLAFIEQRGLRSVSVAGHSFGGTVALVAALMEQRRGDRLIGRLILLNAPAYPQQMRRGLAFLTLPVLPYVALGLVPPILTAREALETVNPTTPRGSDADAIAYAEPLYSAAGRHALIATTRAIARYQASGAVPDYSRLRLPALLMWCRNDPTVPLSTGERLAREIAQARLAVLDHCDHSPAEERPVETVRLVDRFLTGQTK